MHPTYHQCQLLCSLCQNLIYPGKNFDMPYLKYYLFSKVLEHCIAQNPMRFNIEGQLPPLTINLIFQLIAIWNLPRSRFPQCGVPTLRKHWLLGEAQPSFLNFMVLISIGNLPFRNSSSLRVGKASSPLLLNVHRMMPPRLSLQTDHSCTPSADGKFFCPFGVWYYCDYGLPIVSIMSQLPNTVVLSTCASNRWLLRLLASKASIDVMWVRTALSPLRIGGTSGGEETVRSQKVGMSYVFVGFCAGKQNEPRGNRYKSRHCPGKSYGISSFNCLFWSSLFKFSSQLVILLSPLKSSSLGLPPNSPLS